MRRYIFSWLLVFTTLFFVQSCSTNINVYEKYHRAVVLLYHSYYYKVTVNDHSWYLGYNPQSRSYEWNADISQLKVKPYSAYGTGFFIDGQGRIATNKHVVNDWFNSYDSRYRSIFQKWIEDNKNLSAHHRDSANRMITLWTNIYNTTLDYFEQDNAGKQITAWKYWLDKYSSDETLWTGLLSYMPQAKFEVYSLQLGYALNGSTVTQVSDFKECLLQKSSDKDNIDLAVIQTKDKKTPPEAGAFIDLSSIKTNSSLKVGDEVSMIGFNLGPELAISKNGLQVQKTDGKISQQSDGDRVLYSISALHGSSGSPVFNKEGELVAVNFAGLDFTQNFNYGVLAQHLKTLIRP